MAGQIEALMGMVSPDQPDQAELARQLRSDRNLGQFFQGSGSQRVRDAGKQMTSDAMSSAQTAGTRKQQALTRSVAADKEKYDRGRDAAGDIIKANALEQSLKGYSGIKDFTDAEGKPVMYGTNNRTGVFEEVPDTKNLKPYNRYANSGGAASQGWTNSELLSGAPIKVNTLTDEIFAFGEKFPNKAAFLEKYPNERIDEEATAAGVIEGEKEWQKGLTKEAITEVTDLRANTKSLGAADGQLRTIVNALDTGAMSGPVADWLPTMKESTAQLNSAVSGLTLDALTQYKLTPVSDKDLAELRSMVKPNLYGESLRRWAVHKQESVKRMQEANNIVEDYVRDHGKVPYGNARKELEAEIEQVLHGDGFDFAFDIDTTGVEVPEQKVTRPDWVASDDQRWDSLTPEQQQQVIEARGGG